MQSMGAEIDNISPAGATVSMFRFANVGKLNANTRR
jgi:hypothetical protein